MREKRKTMILKRLSMLLFIFGAVTAIFSGIFPSTPETENIKTIIIITLGLFVGLLNISQEQEYGFLIAAGVFVLCSAALMDLLGNSLLMNAIGPILQNFIIFISPAAIVVAFKIIVEFASQAEVDMEEEEETFIEFYSRLSKKERIWDVIILIAVSFTLVTMILRLFFDVGRHAGALNMINYGTLALFFIYLFLLYTQARDFKVFLKTSWLDIIAVIPFIGIFQLAKTFRFVKILQVFSHANGSAKVLSRESGFNKNIMKRRIGKRRKK